MKFCLLLQLVLCCLCQWHHQHLATHSLPINRSHLKVDESGWFFHPFFPWFIIFLHLKSQTNIIVIIWSKISQLYMRTPFALLLTRLHAYKILNSIMWSCSKWVEISQSPYWIYWKKPIAVTIIYLKRYRWVILHSWNSPSPLYLTPLLSASGDATLAIISLFRKWRRLSTRFLEHINVKPTLKMIKDSFRKMMNRLTGKYIRININI